MGSVIYGVEGVGGCLDTVRSYVYTGVICWLLFLLLSTLYLFFLIGCHQSASSEYVCQELIPEV